MPVPRAPQVTLANDEQSQLESIVRAHSTPQALSPLSVDPEGRGCRLPVESAGGQGSQL